MSFRNELNKITKTILENNELNKAEVLLAANSIVDELQKVIKNLGEIRNEDLPAIVTKIKAELGVESANKFTADVTEQIDGALDTIRSAKEAVDNAVLELSGEKVPSSIENELGDMDDMGDDIDAELEGGMDDMDTEDEFDDIAPEAPLGRLRKESIENKKRSINENQRTVTISKSVPKPKFAKFTVEFRDGTSTTKQRTGAPLPQLKQELHVWAKKYNKDNRDNPIVKIKSLNESKGIPFRKK